MIVDAANVGAVLEVWEWPDEHCIAHTKAAQNSILHKQPVVLEFFFVTDFILLTTANKIINLTNFFHNKIPYLSTWSVFLYEITVVA